MQIVDKKIAISDLQKMSEKMFDRLVKAVVDIEREIMVIDAPMHVDEEEFLLEEGSKQNNLSGINIYPARSEENWIEFDAMINIRVGQGNRTRGVDDPIIREKIKKIISKLIEK